MQPSPGMTLREEGGYTWVAARNLYRDVSTLWTLLKVFAVLVAAAWLVLLLFSLPGQGLAGAAGQMGWLSLGLAAGVLGLVVFVYFAYAVANGGKEKARFEMDEKGIRVIRKAPPSKRGTTDAGQRMFTGFASVTRVTVDEKHHTIRLRATISSTQVFAAPEDFDFVRDYILAHCPKAEVVRRGAR